VLQGSLSMMVVSVGVCECASPIYKGQIGDSL